MSQHTDIELEPQVIQLIEMARDEDLGDGDRSAALMADAALPATFRLIAEQSGVFAGQPIGAAVLRAYDPGIEVVWTELGQDGAIVPEPPAEVAMLRGPLGMVLSAERVFLNFLARLCGVATQTRRYVDAVAGTGADILDTRKTLPGWRWLDKYAVRCGGGRNHRMGLHDAVMIKDNHLSGVQPGMTSGAVFQMLNQLYAEKTDPAEVVVEADTMQQVEQLLSVVGIDVILLDNFDPARLREAVALRASLGLAGKVAFESSGGITLETIRGVAETGVERISVGALTHSVPNFSMTLERTA